jgi:hypothetical protein
MVDTSAEDEVSAPVVRPEVSPFTTISDGM